MLYYFRKIYYIFLLPHLFLYLLLRKSVRKRIEEDIKLMNIRLNKNEGLLYYLTYEKPYRNLFYHRIGKISRILNFYVPQYNSFIIGDDVDIAGGIFVLNHPFSSVINAKSIGYNFTICQLTTIGNSRHGRNDLIPIIGNNVTLGANVTIIGNITIGDNVVVGAGAVVVKDVPSNCVVVGNPAHVVRRLV